MASGKGGNAEDNVDDVDQPLPATSRMRRHRQQAIDFIAEKVGLPPFSLRHYIQRIDSLPPSAWGEIPRFRATSCQYLLTTTARGGPDFGLFLFSPAHILQGLLTEPKRYGL